MNMEKDYLGDGVYVEYDGYQIKLTTFDGISTTNTIYLEPSVLKSFDYFRGRIQAPSSAIDE